MTKLNINQKDIEETKIIGELLSKIDKIDSNYANRISDEMFKYQPFFLSVLLGYSQDVSMEVMDEILKIYFLIWEYFKIKPRCKTKQITKSDFTKIQNRHIAMLKYCGTEPNDNNILNIYSNDLQNIKSKALFTILFFRFEERLILKNMNQDDKGAVIIGIKSFIECFDSICGTFLNKKQGQ